MAGSASLACQVPGCATGGATERCSRCSRLACAAHRTLRAGSYTCATCDEEALAARRAAEQAASAREAAAAAEARRTAQREADALVMARGRSRHTWMLAGNVLSVAISALLLWLVLSSVNSQFDWAGATPEQVRVSILEVIGLVGVPVAIMIAVAFEVTATYWYRRDRIDGRLGLTGLAWLTAAPGLLVACVSIVGIGVLAAIAFIAGGAASHEAQQGQIRQAVRDGVDDAMRDA